MNIQQIYSTNEREIILNYLLDNPDEEVNMNALARKLKLSPGQVHHFLKILENYGLFKGKKIIDNAMTRAFRIIKNLNEIGSAKISEIIRNEVKKVTGIGLYGSWSNGTNRKSSDLDLWVKTNYELSDLELARLNKELSIKIKAQTELLVVTPKRMQHLKEKTESLYHALFNSITLWGESL